MTARTAEIPISEDKHVQETHGMDKGDSTSESPQSENEIVVAVKDNLLLQRPTEHHYANVLIFRASELSSEPEQLEEVDITEFDLQVAEGSGSSDSHIGNEPGPSNAVQQFQIRNASRNSVASEHPSVRSASYRRVRFQRSRTSFLDVSRDISEISRDPMTEGGFCDVHVANMTGVGKVALKKLRLLGSVEKARKRFRYEAEIWIRLDHPNVLRFYGICQSGPTLYMVSPWQENGHMTAYLKCHADVDKLHLLCQVADALVYLHSNDPKIIHGDIKGANVLVSQRGDALLCDFGLSTIMSEIAIMSGIPSGVQDGGSIRWLAPELMEGQDPKTESTDVFSFAMLTIEAYTGSPPFPELKLDAAVIHAIISGRRPNCPFDLAGRRNSPEARLWRLMQLCWHAEKQVRPKMDDVCTLLRTMERSATRKKRRDALQTLPKPLINFVVKEKDSLDEYIEALKKKPLAQSPSLPDVNKSSKPPFRWKKETLRSLVSLPLHILISIVAISQVGICASLWRDSSDSRMDNAVLHRAVVAFGLATACYLVSLHIYFISVIGRLLNLVAYKESRNFSLPANLSYGLRVLAWLLSVTDIIMSFAISFNRRIDNFQARKSFTLLYVHDGLACLLCALLSVLLYAVYLAFQLRRHRLSRVVFDPALNTFVARPGPRHVDSGLRALTTSAATSEFLDSAPALEEQTGQVRSWQMPDDSREIAEEVALALRPNSASTDQQS